MSRRRRPGLMALAAASIAVGVFTAAGVIRFQAHEKRIAEAQAQYDTLRNQAWDCLVSNMTFNDRETAFEAARDAAEQKRLEQAATECSGSLDPFSSTPKACRAAYSRLPPETAATYYADLERANAECHRALSNRPDDVSEKCRAAFSRLPPPPPTAPDHVSRCSDTSYFGAVTAMMDLEASSPALRRGIESESQQTALAEFYLRGFSAAAHHRPPLARLSTIFFQQLLH